jgi:hypothetical protein
MQRSVLVALGLILLATLFRLEPPRVTISGADVVPVLAPSYGSVELSGRLELKDSDSMQCLLIGADGQIISGTGSVCSSSSSVGLSSSMGVNGHRSEMPPQAGLPVPLWHPIPY